MAVERDHLQWATPGGAYSRREGTATVRRFASDRGLNPGVVAQTSVRGGALLTEQLDRCRERPGPSPDTNGVHSAR